jgi:hypothetical protein
MNRQLASFVCGMTLLTTSCMSPFGAPDSEGWFLDAPVVSVSETAPPANKLSKGEQVGAKFCTLDAELLKRIGMVDEVTRRALEKSGAKYLVNAKYSSKNLSCIKVEGFAGK